MGHMCRGCGSYSAGSLDDVNSVCLEFLFFVLCHNITSRGVAGAHRVGVFSLRLRD